MDFLGSLLDTVRGIAPTIAGTLATGATGNPLIGGAVAAAIRGIVGTTDDGSPLRELEAQKIMENPELYLKLRVSLQELEIEKLREETKQMGIVNQTMRAESESESTLQRIWRPILGLMFGFMLFCDYFAAQIVLALAKSEFAWKHVPPEIYMLWTAILGVTAASRGVEKVAKTSPVHGLMGIVKSSLGK
jgi:hypothetical protein